MGKFLPITKEFKNKYWKRPQNMFFAKKISAIPVALGELRFLSLFLPLVFLKNKENKFVLMALLNIEPSGNLFIDPNGRWLGRYVPWFFKAYPFSLGLTKEKKSVLLIDEEYISDNSKDIPFFKEGEEFSEEIKNILKFLLEREKGYQIVSEICDKLSQNELLEEFNFKIKIGENEKSITGLFKVNFEKLFQLDNEKFLVLKDPGILLVIYSHFISLLNFNTLINLLRIKSQKISKKPTSELKVISGKKESEKSLEENSQDLEEILKNLKFPEK